MDSRYDLATLFVGANVLLERYIQEYDRLFKQRLGDEIDKCASIEELEQIDEDAWEHASAIKEQLATEQGSFERSSLFLLGQFLVRLGVSISLLKTIYEHLNMKAEGGRYGFIAYWVDVWRLRKAEKKRGAVGNDVQKAWNRLVGS